MQTVANCDILSIEGWERPSPINHLNQIKIMTSQLFKNTKTGEIVTQIPILELSDYVEVESLEVPMQLVGQDGNAFAIVGRFMELARKNGCSLSAIEKVTDEAQSGDYNHLLQTIIKHTVSPVNQD